jgi:hypothetical protein
LVGGWRLRDSDFEGFCLGVKVGMKVQKSWISGKNDKILLGRSGERLVEGLMMRTNIVTNLTGQ